MRSFQQFVFLVFLFVVQNVQAQTLSTQIDSFYEVTLPYDKSAFAQVPFGLQNHDVNAVVSVDSLSQEAMKILLSRLAANDSLLNSELGRQTITGSKTWLKSYFFKARKEEGVTVGQDIEFVFDGERLFRMLKQNKAAVWSPLNRPSTLIMGSFVQAGHVFKLDQQALRYREDLPLTVYPQWFGLPAGFPPNQNNWILPIRDGNPPRIIQETLLASDQSYLLSFKLVEKNSRLFALEWMLFSKSGQLVAHSSHRGDNARTLLNLMFKHLAYRYRQLTQTKKTEEWGSLNIVVHDLKSERTLKLLQKRLSSQQSEITSIQLQSVNAEGARLVVNYNGSYQNLVNWIKQWPELGSLHERRSYNQIDILLSSELSEEPQGTTTGETP
ncbi:DUF2066 domain-containing protein [Thiomicrorhabdus heinhorstiae]|uniref:DUF2066 domain-containing protein n=1 Tax=Thiomicrorhabdus heinhorstiae TaxID=2748010 RepID=A0ABS0BZ50_9GAMM|nr:DUF2066 domain-containing protein [Thiomicrorhabdus heinhorstiae]MBF6058259.1 DUF2066 domain-containing protein [Thiomicrorhabdus heinhorstiae]